MPQLPFKVNMYFSANQKAQLQYSKSGKVRNRTWTSLYCINFNLFAKKLLSRMWDDRYTDMVNLMPPTPIPDFF